MLLAVCRLLALDIEIRHPSARVMRATLVTDVDHAVPSMLTTVRRRLAALNVKARSPCAGVMGATPHS